MGGELGRLGAVVIRVHAAAAALRDMTGQRRVGGGGFPPGVPALGVPAGEDAQVHIGEAQPRHILLTVPALDPVSCGVAVKFGPALPPRIGWVAWVADCYWLGFL